MTRRGCRNSAGPSKSNEGDFVAVAVGQIDARLPGRSNWLKLCSQWPLRSSATFEAWPSRDSIQKVTGFTSCGAVQIWCLWRSMGTRSGGVPSNGPRPDASASSLLARHWQHSSGLATCRTTSGRYPRCSAHPRAVSPGDRQRHRLSRRSVDTRPGPVLSGSSRELVKNPCRHARSVANRTGRRPDAPRWVS